jgi:DNA-binding MarR family transcriptional regulator
MGHDAMTDRQYRSLAQFRYALRVFLRFSEQAARNVGLTPAQHQLLLAIRGWPGGDEPSIGELAKRLQSTPQSTLELARRAEEAQLITITTSHQDRRRQVVDLTPRGEVRLEALSAAHRDELRRFRREMDAILDELG